MSGMSSYQLRASSNVLSRRHGKFRPTLMKLVSSNEPSLVTSTVSGAIASYRESPTAASAAAPAITALAKLKGVGPATASLLLAVHDPDGAVFFSDEAFWWLCCGGKRDTPIKYNAKEYADLDSKARELSTRLGVRSVDVEQVAFVVMRDGSAGPGQAPAPAPLPSSKPKPSSKAATKWLDPKPAAKKTKEISSASKRKKVASEDPEVQGPLRRSKRGKAS